MAEIWLYEGINYSGNYEVLTSSDSDLFELIGNDVNDEISSFIVYSGEWTFYDDPGYTGVADGPFGPGHYPWVEDWGIVNDSVSSVLFTG